MQVYRNFRDIESEYVVSSHRGPRRSTSDTQRHGRNLPRPVLRWVRSTIYLDLDHGDEYRTLRVMSICGVFARLMRGIVAGSCGRVALNTSC